MHSEGTKFCRLPSQGLSWFSESAAEQCLHMPGSALLQMKRCKSLCSRIASKRLAGLWYRDQWIVVAQEMQNSLMGDAFPDESANPAVLPCNADIQNHHACASQAQLQHASCNSGQSLQAVQICSPFMLQRVTMSLACSQHVMSGRRCVLWPARKFCNLGFMGSDG